MLIGHFQDFMEFHFQLNKQVVLPGFKLSPRIPNHGKPYGRFDAKALKVDKVDMHVETYGSLMRSRHSIHQHP